jgi:hypothetical protein
MENTKIMCAVMLDTKVSCSSCRDDAQAAVQQQQQLPHATLGTSFETAMDNTHQLDPDASVVGQTAVADGLLATVAQQLTQALFGITSHTTKASKRRRL